MKRMVLLGSLALAACVVFGSACAFSEDWPSLEKKMREAYGKYCGNIKDMKMVSGRGLLGRGGDPVQQRLFPQGQEVPHGERHVRDDGGGRAAMKTTIISDGAKIWMISPMGTMEVPATKGGSTATIGSAAATCR